MCITPLVSLGDITFDREDLSKEKIIQLTNSERVTAGLSALQENSVLDFIAAARAKDILDNQYPPSHVSHTGQKVSHIALKFGYKYRVIAENLAGGVFANNSRLVGCWMQSPAHRKNILSPRIREIGVSVIKGTHDGKETWVSVQVFGLQMGNLSPIHYGESPLIWNSVRTAAKEGPYPPVIKIVQKID